MQDPYCAWDVLQKKCVASDLTVGWDGDKKRFLQSVTKGENKACPHTGTSDIFIIIIIINFQLKYLSEIRRRMKDYNKLSVSKKTVRNIRKMIIFGFFYYLTGVFLSVSHNSSGNYFC